MVLIVRVLLGACQVREVDETLAREAARLRTATGRAATVSATDAIVAAFAGARSGSIVVTSGPADLGALAEHTAAPITIAAV